VEDTFLWSTCEYILNHFQESKDMHFFMSSGKRLCANPSLCPFPFSLLCALWCVVLRGVVWQIASTIFAVRM
jgi:hypothetical protein